MIITPIKPIISTAPTATIIKELKANPKKSIVYFNSVWVHVPVSTFLQYGFNEKSPGEIFKERGLFRCDEKSSIGDRLLQVVQVVPQLKYLGADSTPEFQTIEKIVSVVLNLSSSIDYMYITPNQAIAQLISYYL